MLLRNRNQTKSKMLHPQSVQVSLLNHCTGQTGGKLVLKPISFVFEAKKTENFSKNLRSPIASPASMSKQIHVYLTSHMRVARYTRFPQRHTMDAPFASATHRMEASSSLCRKQPSVQPTPQRKTLVACHGKNYPYRVQRSRVIISAEATAQTNAKNSQTKHSLFALNACNII